MKRVVFWMTALVIAMFWAMTVQAQESQDSIESVNKAAIEREQNDARISSAEREQARPKVKSRPHEYDLVQGPVANDKVFTTVNLFESGVLSAEAAILQLKAYKTYDQLSFHTNRVIKNLKFVESIEV